MNVIRNIMINKMSNKDLYCSSLWSRISDLALLKVEYEWKLETSEDEFTHKRDYEVYKDLKSNFRYNFLLYQKDCVGFGAYLVSLMK
jgi:hypothetical protein